MRDEQHDLAAIAGVPNLGDPVGHPPAELDDRLAGDVPRPCGAVVDRQLLQRRAARQPGAHVVHARNQRVRFRVADVRRLRPGIVEARSDLVDDLSSLRAGVLRLRDEQTDAPRARHVVQERRRRIRVLEALAERDDRDLVERRDRSLRGGVIPSDGFDRVADELDADRLLVPGGIEVDDPAAHEELAVLIDRILPRVPRLDEQVAERLRIDVRPRHQVDGHRQASLRRADPGQERGGRRHDDPCSSGGDGVKRPRPGAGDLEVRRQSTVGIDFMGGEGQHEALDIRLGKAIERRQEEPRIRRRALDVAIGRHDEHDQSLARRACHVERLRGGGQPGNTPVQPGPMAAHTRLQPAERRLEERPQREGCRGGHSAVSGPPGTHDDSTWSPAGLGFDSLEDRRCGVARLDRHENHTAAARLDSIAADDLVRRPVRPLDEDVRLQRPDDVGRRLIVEHDDGLHGAERGDDFRALRLRRNGPGRSLVRPNRSVGVDTDNENIPFSPRSLQVPEVAGVQQVEDTVRENDPLAGPSELGHETLRVRKADDRSPATAAH